MGFLLGVIAILGGIWLIKYGAAFVIAGIGLVMVALGMKKSS